MNKTERIEKLEREARLLRNALKDIGLIKVSEEEYGVHIRPETFETVPERFQKIENEFNYVGGEIASLRGRVQELEIKRQASKKRRPS